MSSVTLELLFINLLVEPTLHLSNQLNASFPQPKPQPKPQESPITVDPLTPRIVDAAMVDDIPNADDPIMPISEASIQPSNLTGRVIRTSDEAIAEGGFASIFIGTFEETKVAIKIIKPSYHQSSDRLQKVRIILIVLIMWFC